MGPVSWAAPFVRRLCGGDSQDIAGQGGASLLRRYSEHRLSAGGLTLAPIRTEACRKSVSEPRTLVHFEEVGKFVQEQGHPRRNSRPQDVSLGGTGTYPISVAPSFPLSAGPRSVSEPAALVWRLPRDELRSVTPAEEAAGVGRALRPVSWAVDRHRMRRPHHLLRRERQHRLQGRLAQLPHQLLHRQPPSLDQPHLSAAPRPPPWPGTGAAPHSPSGSQSGTLSSRRFYPSRSPSASLGFGSPDSIRTGRERAASTFN